MTTYTVNIDWPAMHDAFATLDAARATSDVRLGSDALSDALGGAYYPPAFEERGLIGAIALLRGLQSITEAAWTVVHKAVDRAKAAGTKRERAELDARVRSAVSVMLAAKPAYDLLAAAGLVELGAHVITRGNDGTRVYLTGLHWLAGLRQDRLVSVEQARAIAGGAGYSAVLSERDPQHVAPIWM